MSATVRAGALLALVGTAHAAANARLLRRPVPGSRCGLRYSVLIPARNEAMQITACLDSVRDQGAAEVLVLDDRSTDSTVVLARAAGARVVTGAPLPAGWLGKPHACAQLAAAADPGSEVLVFLDADVVLEPHALDAAVALLEHAGLDVVSPHPRQVADTPAERLVQPLLQWSILTFLSLRLAEHSKHPALTAANGQLIIVRRDAYDRSGGHATVRAAVLEDLALVRAMKSAGARGGIVDGTQVAHCRMYRGWAQLRDGYAKSLWSAFGSPAGSAAVLGMLALAYLVPPIAAVRGSVAGGVGTVAAVAGRVVTARRTGGRVLPDALGHPASIAVFGYLTIRSHVQHGRGRLRWKGRPL